MPILLILIAISSVAWLQMPRLIDPYKVDEDFRSFYWMNEFQESDLYPSKSSNKLRLQDINLPRGKNIPIDFYSLGYSLLFYAASFFVSPVTFSKLLPFFLATISTWYLYQYGKLVQNHRTGVVLSVGFLALNLISPTSISILSGFQRAFGLPLLIALLYHLHKGNRTACVIVSVISASIYPPVFLIAIATWGLTSLKWTHPLVWKIDIDTNMMAYVFLAFAAGALMLIPAVYPRFVTALTEPSTASPDQESTYDHLWKNPKYQLGGRYPLFYLFPFVGRGGLFTFFPTALYSIVLTLIGILLYLAKGKGNVQVPTEIRSLLVAAFILYVLSWLSIYLTDSFLLYLPSRYTQNGLFLFLFLFVLLNLSGSEESLTRLVNRNSRFWLWGTLLIAVLILGLIIFLPNDRTMARKINVNMKWILGSLGLILIVLAVINDKKTDNPRVTSPRIPNHKISLVLKGVGIVGLVVIWGLYARRQVMNPTLDPSPEERAMLEFLTTTPKDSLIAGIPWAVDKIQLFAKRQILFGLYMPSDDEALTRDALNAYYTDDKQVVLDFCKEYGVDYLVIDHQAFTAEALNGLIYFEPYSSEIQAKVEPSDDFALLDISPAAEVFQSGRFSVASCEKMQVFR
jgi:hypothetical protein